MKVKRLLTSLVLALVASGAAAQGSLEIIPLRHRTADQVIPILQPLVDPGGSLTGQYNQLIVRTSPRNLADIRAALDAIDRPQRRLAISVRFEDSADRERSGIAVRPSGVQVIDARVGRDERVDQRLHVLEGSRAMIASGQSRPLPQRQVIRTPAGTVVQDITVNQEIATGFEVVPRVAGRTVMLEIAPQRELPGALPGSVQSHRASTTISAPLGEWFEIGASAQAAAQDRRGILSGTQSRGGESRRIWVKVEEPGN